jgi:DNA-binding SARP family transcriptional activator
MPKVAVQATLRVDVLGPLTITPVFAPASDPVRAIVAYLAMNGERELTLEEIQNAIWPLTDAGTDIKKPAMRNYMVDARKTVGERHLPSASGRPGYRLQNFNTDWSELQSLLTQATNSPKGESLALRRQALDLAKGLPFTADTSRYFTWTFTSSVVYKIVEAVTALAHGLGTELVLSGDLASAEVVLRQGLLTDPAALMLWEDLTDVILETRDQSLLGLHWKAASLVLRAVDVVALHSRADG